MILYICFKLRLDDNAKSNQEFLKWREGGGTFHKSACIHPTAVIEKGAVVHSQSHLAANAYVGSGAIVGAGVTIGESTRIGYHNLPPFSILLFFPSVPDLSMLLWDLILDHGTFNHERVDDWGVFNSCKMVLNFGKILIF